MKTKDVINAIAMIAAIGEKMAPQPFSMILGLVHRVGAPQAIKLIEGFGKDEITEEDIQKLHDLVKPPEEYFK